MAATGFTLIGSLDAAEHAKLSPTGQLTPPDGSWKMDWWIGTGDRWHMPEQVASVRQSRPGAGPVVDTRMRVGQDDVVCRVFGVAAPGGSHVVVEITNEAKAPVALAIAFSSKAAFDSVIFDRQPSTVDEVEGLGHLSAEERANTAIFPLLHTATVKLVVPAKMGMPVSNLPESDAVVRGWESIIERSGRFSFGDDTVTQLAAVSRARLLLEVPNLAPAVANIEPGAGRILEALATSASANDVVRSLQAFAPTFPLSLPGAPIDAAAVVSGIGRAAQLLGDAKACEELVEPTAQLTHLVERSGDGEAGREALVGLSRLLRASDHIEPAAELEAQTLSWNGERADVPHGLDALATFGQQASESGAFGDDDAAAAARYWLGARALAVRETPSGLQLLPGFPAAWRGGALEVHEALITGGRASFAIRWHGYRPALLWDIQLNDVIHLDGVTGGGLLLTCPELDPDWSTTELKGEALLAGTSEGLAAVPSPGESFS